MSVLRNSQLGPAIWDDELLASEQTCQVMAFDHSFGGFGYLWRSVWIYNKYMIYNIHFMLRNPVMRNILRVSSQSKHRSRIKLSQSQASGKCQDDEGCRCAETASVSETIQ